MRIPSAFTGEVQVMVYDEETATKATTRLGYETGLRRKRQHGAASD